MSLEPCILRLIAAFSNSESVIWSKPAVGFLIPMAAGILQAWTILIPVTRIVDRTHGSFNEDRIT